MFAVSNLIGSYLFAFVCLRKSEREDRRKQAADVLGEVRKSGSSFDAFRSLDGKGRYVDSGGDEEGSFASKRSRLARDFILRREGYSRNQSHDSRSYDGDRYERDRVRDRDRDCRGEDDIRGRYSQRDESRYYSSRRDDSRQKPVAFVNLQQSEGSCSDEESRVLLPEKK